MFDMDQTELGPT